MRSFVSVVGRDARQARGYSARALLWLSICALSPACGSDSTSLEREAPEALRSPGVTPDAESSDPTTAKHPPAGGALPDPHDPSDAGEPATDLADAGAIGGISDARAADAKDSDASTSMVGVDAGLVRPVDSGSPESEWPLPQRSPMVLLPETVHIEPGHWTLVDAFPGVTFDDPVAFAQLPDRDWVFVAEREGRLFAFQKDPAAAEKRLVLDLSQHTQGEGDSGLLGLVFHPEFGSLGSQNGAYVYLHYAHSEMPVRNEVPHPRTPVRSRLARFTVDLDTLIIDPASELLLIDQADESVWHQGGAMFFGPDDGFLYLTVGDEGEGGCTNCQRIDKDLFSGVLRLDVDMQGEGKSHPIPRQPATGRTANYFIPDDNPFVGRAGVLEEFYALGLRSPHSMSVDPVDGIVWIADVGGATKEELDVLRAGANYQWNVREGFDAAAGRMPHTPAGTWTDPVLDLPRTESTSVIGGYVYRGSRFAELEGKYIFGDFGSGKIWALTYTYDGEDVEVIERELLMQTGNRGKAGGITRFGVDADGELYVLQLGAQSVIKRFDRSEDSPNEPELLSETRMFHDMHELAPNGLARYEVIQPLYSDGAEKTRWLALPAGAPIQFSATGPWRFPPGTAFVKHFEMLLDESDATSARRLETRILVASPDGSYYGISYKWLPDGSDAEVVTKALTQSIDVRTREGAVRTLEYLYPGPNDCGACHSAEAGYVLGVRTAQLNRRGTGDWHQHNQLEIWSRAGFLDQALSPSDIDGLPRLVALSDASASLEARVRSYWDANCSQCHGVVLGMRAAWDARYTTPLEEQGVIWGPLSSDGADPNSFVVAPGDLEASFLYRRSQSADPILRMPPLGRDTADTAYVQLLREWILSLDPRSLAAPNRVLLPARAGFE